MSEILDERKARNLIGRYGIDEMEVEDWIDISRDYILSEEFIREFKDEVDWFIISKYQKLSESFMDEFKSELYWINIAFYQTLSEDFINKNIDFTNWNWTAVVTYQTLSENFIRTHSSKFGHTDWKRISIYQKLSENFIMEFKDYVDWTNIFLSQDISNDILNYILMNNLINQNSLLVYQDYIRTKLNLKMSGSLCNKFVIGYLEMNKDFSDFRFRNTYKYTSTGQVILIKDNKPITVSKRANLTNAPIFCKCKVYYDDIMDDYGDVFDARKVTILVDEDNICKFKGRTNSLFNKSLIINKFKLWK